MKSKKKECCSKDKEGKECCSTKGNQTVCPMSGKKVDAKIFADYKGKRVFFCGKGCMEAFKKNPAKYMKGLEAKGVKLAAAPKPQTLCPIMGGKINKKVFADYKGKRVYFCCAGCISKFNKEPEKFVKKMEAQGIALAQLPSKPKAPKKPAKKAGG